jgi:TM2 domain-containing membrane protein YozV
MSTPANPTATMEPKVRCPYCSELIAFAAKKCKHCGEFFDPALRQSRMPQAWNPGVAAVLSLVIPRAGQMYKGQIGPGIWWLIGTVFGYCVFIIPGPDDLAEWVEVLKTVHKRKIQILAFANNDYAGYGPGTIEQFRELWRRAPAPHLLYV